MLREVNGDLLKSTPHGSLLGIPVNTVGVAGKGLACYMKIAWPEQYKRYCKDCKRGRIATGELCVYDHPKFQLAMLPTKFYWGNPSDLDLIKVTLTRLLKHMKDHSISVCYLPQIGCGERTGGLDYLTEVKPVIEEVFGSEEKFDVVVYSW
jgi:hypothetical protein